MTLRKTTLLGLAIALGGTALAAPLTAAAEPEFDIRGRLHLDFAVHDEDDIELDDGFLNRRARLGMQGKIDENWSGIVEYDFAENGTSASDVYLSRKLPVGSVKIGYYKVPMGFWEVTSTNTMPFIERSSSNTAIVDARRIGVGYEYFNGPFGYQGMAFGRAIGDDNTGDEPLGFASRFTYAPEFGAGRVHLGASFAYEDVQDATEQRYRERPESRVDGTRLVDTGVIDMVSSTTKYGLEAMWQSGPFSVMSEYFMVSVDRDAGEEPDFSGWHVQGSWILTGQTRSYRNGTFRGVPVGDKGAWELSARYSSLDLTDDGFQGGEQDNVTLGLNYYSSSNVRFMLNYIMVDVEDSGAVVDGIVVGDDSPGILLTRAMFYF